MARHKHTHCPDCGRGIGSALGRMVHRCEPVADRPLVEPVMDPAGPVDRHLTPAEVDALGIVSAAALQAGVLSVAARAGDRPSLAQVEELALRSRLGRLTSA